MPKFKLGKTGRWVIKTFFLAVVIFFVVRYIYINWATIGGKSWHIEWVLVLLAILCVWISFFLLVELWRESLEACGSKLKYRLAWSTWYRTLLVKYIPGKVWAVVGLVYFTIRKGETSEKSAAAAVLWTAMSFPGLSFVFLITVPFWRIFPSQYIIIIAILIIVLMAFTIHPKVFYPALNLALRKVGKPQINPKVKYSGLFRLFLISSVVCLLNGIAFVIFVHSLTLLELHDFPVLIGSFSLSFLFGLISVFAPAGIGVREGVLLAVLSRHFSPELAIVISIGARLWLTIAEMSFVGISWFFTRSNREYETSNITDEICSG